MPHDYADEPYLWVHICELALAEQSPEHRQQLLLEARKAMLQRARALEDTPGSGLECATLETAVAFIESIPSTLPAESPECIPFESFKAN